MERVEFERSIPEFETYINRAKVRSGCLIVNIHSQYKTFNTTKLGQIIDKAIAEGLEIATISEAYSMFSNVEEYTDFEKGLSGVSAQGFRIGASYVDDYVVEFNPTPINQNDSQDIYPRRKLSTTQISSAIASDGGWELGAGILFTDRRGSADYTYQMFHPIRSHDVYKRHWTERGYWSQFWPVGYVNSAHVTYQSETKIILPHWLQVFNINHESLSFSKSLITNAKTTLPNPKV